MVGIFVLLVFGILSLFFFFIVLSVFKDIFDLDESGLLFVWWMMEGCCVVGCILLVVLEGILFENDGVILLVISFFFFCLSMWNILGFCRVLGDGVLEFWCLVLRGEFCNRFLFCLIVFVFLFIWVFKECVRFWVDVFGGVDGFGRFCDWEVIDWEIVFILNGVLIIYLCVLDFFLV